jgi:hypothetical protein
MSVRNVNGQASRWGNLTCYQTLMTNDVLTTALSVGDRPSAAVCSAHTQTHTPSS